MPGGFMSKSRAINQDTTRVVRDPFAKVAAAYTGGFCTVRYVADRVATDGEQTILLPAVMEHVSPEAIERCWAYVNHEMGHIEVERRLKVNRDARLKVRCSEKLYRAIPIASRLQGLGIEPGARIELMTEFMAAIPEYAYRLAMIHGRALAAKERVQLAKVLTVQLKTIWNAVEDPRMEAMVGSRWVGAKEHLAYGLKENLKEWRVKASDAIAAGNDGDFHTFTIAVCFALHGKTTGFFGPKVSIQVALVADLIGLYKSQADWGSEWGFFDSVNFAIAILCRMLDAPGEVDLSPEAQAITDLVTLGDTPDGQPQPSSGFPQPSPKGESPGKSEGVTSEMTAPEGKSDVLKPGMRIRIKATGQEAVITKVNADGSVEADED